MLPAMGFSYFTSPTLTLIIVFFIFDQEDALLRDTMEAARWCSTRTFKGKLSLPQVVSMDREGRLRAVELLRMSEGLDEEQSEDLREPFIFLFSLQEDHETFCSEIMDTRRMQALSAFET